MQDFSITKLSKSEILEIPIFAEITKEMLEILTDFLTTIRIKKGEFIIREGQEAKEIYFIQSGTVSISKRNYDGSEKLIEEIQAPHFFGEMSLFDTKIRSATVKATSNCKLAVLVWRKIEVLKEEFPQLETYLLKKIIQSLSCKIRVCNAKCMCK